MSELGDALTEQLNAIQALDTASEAQAETGDPWADQYEAFLVGVRTQLNAAAPEDHDHGLGDLSVPSAEEGDLIEYGSTGWQTSSARDLVGAIATEVTPTIDYGSVQIVPDDPPADGTWDTQTVKTADVAFNKDFEDTPTITTAANDGLTGKGTIGASNITADGFLLRFTHLSTDGSQDPYRASWTAIGD